MMQATAWMLASGVGNGNVPLRNAVVESFVVHFRQLGRFFFDGDERDIRAGDFLNQTWVSAVGREFPHLKKKDSPSMFVSGTTSETVTLPLVPTASATNVVTTCNSIALPPGDPRP